MKHTKQEIAEHFSNGKFENIMIYLSDEIVWNIVGENVFTGKAAVKKNCEETSAYFKTVQTEFKTNDTIVSGNKVIIIGTAEFKRDENLLNFISACDVYEFNDKSQIEKISSYCIEDKKRSQNI